MGTTKQLQLRKDLSYNINTRANGKYDYTTVYKFTRDNEQLSINMQDYNGLQHIFNNQGGKGTSIIDFSDTVLPWKFEMNDYLARTRYCLKPYREEPYQVKILKQVPANYNIVGTPTFNGNVVSGFNGNNYLTLKKPFIPQGAWEIVLKFKTNEFAGEEQGLFGYNGAGLFKICLGGDNHIALSLSTVDNDWNIGGITGTTDIELNKFYWVKAEFNGNVYKLSLSDNGIDYNLEGTLETSSVPVFPNTTYLGVVNRDYHSLAGSIDLSESYIKLNEIVAEGSGELIEYAFTHQTLSANGTIGGNSFAVTADNDTNGRNPAYYAFDSNEWTYWRGGNVPGYIEFYNPAPINVTALTWGYFYSYPTSGNVQGSNDYSDWTTITEFTHDSASDFTIDMSGNTNSYKYYRINVSAVNMDVIHCKYLSIVGTVKGYAVENTYQLNENTYVPDQIRNYTINGSVTINDGIASGFSSSDYLAIPYTVESTNIEFYATIIPTYDPGVQDIYDANSNGWNIAIEDMKLRVWYIGGQIWGTTRLNEGVSYDIKVTIDNNWNTSVYYKESNSNDWIFEISGVLNASSYLLNKTLFIGIHSYNKTEPFLGSINLSGCYIKQGDTTYRISATVTEELYGILDIAGDIDVQNPLYCYVNRDQNLIIRQTKNITMDTSNWYLGEVELGE